MPVTVFVWFLITCKVWSQVVGIQINYIKVPMAVKNDSKSAIVLDCDYSLRPDDTYLVVKCIPVDSPSSPAKLRGIEEQGGLEI
ncbi:unnamed protein product [Acanthoscelides obtectus]|uniref:Uncharacterized protein n=1 Tax=Acanthoscelides obtectus TaxID=200917 RepID=A0A9P0M1J8_ACAOB|nr:unnamed protein product [Acanthoscelides obtectus]CAK1670892.1 hypothetical protein AOBTE_LOCUS27899 [Acanthoscelides obtectus]